MKKKNSPKKAAAKKAAPKKAASKKTAPKKPTPKKAAPKKSAPKKDAAALKADGFRPVCITEGIRLSSQCMSEAAAFAAAQAHKNLPGNHHHQVDTESC